MELQTSYEANSTRACWVIGLYIGERAKSVKEHANAGIGYFIQQEGGAGQSYSVSAASIWPLDMGLIPENMEYATEDQHKKLEKLWWDRKGVKPPPAPKNSFGGLIGAEEVFDT